MTRRTLLALPLALTPALTSALTLGATRVSFAQVAPAAVAADRWADEIARFAAADAASPFAPGGIVFVGSSSIRLWNLAAAFPNHRVLNRGFGGTQILDSVRHVDLLVIRHKPAIVVFYAGDNDLSAGRTPEQVAADFRAFATRVHAALPTARIAFIAVKPSIARWSLIGKVREANGRVRADCDRDDRLGFVDVDAAMLGWDGKPRPELFVEDGLHMSAKGYEIWNVLLRPFLE